jgi:FAD/FMN-containing dehydrogenase
MEIYQKHRLKVEIIAGQVKRNASKSQPVHISKGGVHHFVPLPGDSRFREPPVDVSSLNEIIKIDAQQHICIAEPGVTFSELVRETLKANLIPAVVPELTGISTGGAVAGCSVEAMSYKYGGFHDMCLEYEVITGTGEIITCSPEKDPLIFNMMHGSYGTMGIITMLSFRLIPAKPYVHLEYRHVPSADLFHREILELCSKGEYEFIDGIIHGHDDFVLCLGRFADSVPHTSDYKKLNIFYKSTKTLKEDYLKTHDYCFRYDTECHWLTRTFPPLEWKPVRFAVGRWFLGSTNLIRWSKRLDRILGLKKRPDVVCDVFIPSSRFTDFMKWYEADFRFYPLWIVPYKIENIYPWVSEKHAAQIRDQMFFDCAIYGKPNSDPDVDWSQVLEEKTYECGGIKTLISRNHHSKERFWEIYNRANYEAAKNRLDPHHIFPDLYEMHHRNIL